jgi:TPR repeat protein
MKFILPLLLILCVPLMGCGKKPAEEIVADEGAEGESAPETSSNFLETKARAEAGDANAQSNLGVMYKNGQGVEQDFKKALKWWQKAADQGNAIAQSNLGFMYYNGQGVEQNDVTAYAWWNIAATNGNQKVKKGLFQLAEIMTPAQITEAEELVKEMVKKNPKLLK